MNNHCTHDNQISVHFFDSAGGVDYSGGWLYRYTDYTYEICGWRVLDAYLVDIPDAITSTVYYISCSLPSAMVPNFFNHHPKPLIASIGRTFGPTGSFPYNHKKNVSPYRLTDILFNFYDKDMNLLKINGLRFNIIIEFYHHIK